MKAVGKACLLLALGSLAVVLGVKAESSASATVQTAIKESFRYSSPTTPATPVRDKTQMILTEEPVVQLEAMTVVESILRRDLERTLRDRAAQAEEAKFKWTRGGLLKTKYIGRVQADMGIWPKLMEREHGAWAVREVILKVDLLNLRW